MPILVILFLIATCLPVAWPEPALGYPGEMTLGFVITSLLASSALSLWVRRHAQKSFAVSLFQRWRRRLFFFNLLGTAACIGLGWGWAVRYAFLTTTEDGEHLAPFAELLIPGPYLLIVMANWIVYYPAERALHAENADVGDQFWSLPAFVFFHARQFAFIVLMPVFLITGQRAVTEFAPHFANSWWYQLFSLSIFVTLVVFMPLVARRILGLRRFPEGPCRDRLKTTAARLGFRAELLFWPTRQAVSNAMILGMVPSTRFVVFTDKLLDVLPADELDAVFGHEVGHARHGHLPYYGCFLALSITAVAFALTAGTTVVFGPNWEVPGGWGPLALLGILGCYLFIVFGFLSRVCERQADLAGARTVSCGKVNCDGHTVETTLSASRGPVCGTGARTMARALERVALSGGDEGKSRWRRLGTWLKSWQHGPTTGRVEYLHRVAERLELADRHDRLAFRVRLGLVVGLLAVIVASGFVIGWELVWKLL